MGRSEGARSRSTGRQGSRSTRPVSGPPHPDVRAVPSSERDVTASEKSTRVWETAYRQYGRAWEMTARCGKGDPVAAREMATAPWAVEAAWRQNDGDTRLPW